jgi:hypothetical protein
MCASLPSLPSLPFFLTFSPHSPLLFLLLSCPSCNATWFCILYIALALYCVCKPMRKQINFLISFYIHTHDNNDVHNTHSEHFCSIVTVMTCFVALARATVTAFLFLVIVLVLIILLLFLVIVLIVVPCVPATGWLDHVWCW